MSTLISPAHTNAFASDFLRRNKASLDGDIQSSSLVPYVLPQSSDQTLLASQSVIDACIIPLPDPELCDDIYKHLRASELKKRPALDYMDRIQPYIDARMRSTLINWLVEVSEEYNFFPETLYLAVNYLDRFLSGNVIYTGQDLQIVGVACLMVAAKFEQVYHVPKPDDFCYIADDTCSRDELLESESCVLHYLKFELTTPTAISFLSHFVLCAFAAAQEEKPSLVFECLASYLAELSLLDYAMLRYPPSLVAASAVYLAQYILYPSRKPWNTTLKLYTSYRAKDLEACLKDLLQLSSHHESPSSTDVTAVREKYSQQKYQFAPKLFLC